MLFSLVLLGCADPTDVVHNNTVGTVGSLSGFAVPQDCAAYWSDYDTAAPWPCGQPPETSACNGDTVYDCSGVYRYHCPGGMLVEVALDTLVVEVGECVDVHAIHRIAK